ncbi:MAG: transporter substrate-binding domain-containing protein [Clostridiales bacterium]|jgi:signal transduction histidine kinase|nr:transporter substrate-binding domain-containing protein [Clostridiales bacterium]
MRIAKRALCTVISVIIILSALSSCEADINSSAPAAAKQPFASFLDFPEITDEEIAAIELLKKRRTPFVYGMNRGIEAFEQNGEMHGFAVMFCRLLGELFGMEFQLNLYEWDELMRGLDTHGIDFTGDMALSAERQNGGYIMTDKIAERSLKYTQHINSKSLAEIAQDRKLKFVFVATAATVTDVASLSYYDFETIYADNHTDAYRMLEEGTADAFFDKGVAEADFNVNGELIVQNFFPIINIPVSLTTKNPELEPIISAMQKALQDETFRRYLKDLYDIGEKEFTKHRLLVQITEEEWEYIRNNPVIPFVAEHYNYPLCFYNDHENQWGGIFFDVLTQVEQFTGLKFEQVNDQTEEWPQLLEKLESGQAYVISELLPSRGQQNRFLWAKQALITDYYTLISKADAPNISLRDVMNARVGVTEGTIYAELFNLWFPNHKNVKVYKNPDYAFEAIIRGEIDLVMSSQHQLLALTNYLELSGYKSNIIFDEPSESIIGFNAKQRELRSIFDKVLSVIDLENMSAHWTQRTYDYQAKIAQIAQQRLPLFIAVTVLSFFLIIIMLILFNIKRREGARLEELIALRTGELEAQNDTIKETSQRLEAALISAQEASRAKGDFLSNMSHEIRTPLNAITGMTMIGKTSTETARKDYAFEKIEEASAHLLNIINDILDISKIEAGKFELSGVVFSVKTLLAKVVNVINFRMEEKQQNFTLNIDDRIPSALFGDDQRLMQIITNLLSNAVKFTPEGKDIRLDASLESETGGLCILRFSVSDTGIGIDEDQKERIFTSFEQAENDTTRKYGGTGLGLAISKHIVEKMGGSIGFTSELGKGSVFTFTVPLTKTAETNSAGEEKPAGNYAVPVFEGKTLLLAEDIEINREIAASILEPTLIEIDIASNGAEAVKMAADAPERYDLILMDVQMPEMDGLQATRAIRAINSPNAADIPIIAMTANVFKEDVDKCLQAGMNDHIGKPLNVEELFEKLGKYLHQSS